MAALQCEICGGKLMAKAGGLFECEYCGMQYDKTRIQEMVQEIKGTVKVEGTVAVKGTVKLEGPVEIKGGVTVENLMIRGHQALEAQKWRDAYQYYMQAMDTDPTHADAYYWAFCARYRVRDLEEAALYPEDFINNELYNGIIRYGDSDMKGKMERVRAAGEERQAQKLAAEQSARLAEQAAKKEKIRAKMQLLQDRRNRIRAAQGIIAAGDRHSVCLCLNGTVLAVGDNTYGQCDVSRWNAITYVAAGEDHTVGLRSNGTVVAAGSDQYGQCNVSPWQGIIAIAAGVYHSVGLRSDGTVIATGANDHGQCDVSNWRDIVAISAGKNHTVGLKSNGTVVATTYTGSFYVQQCDVSDWHDIVSVAAGDYATFGIKADGSVVTTYSPLVKEVRYWDNIVAIGAGNDHVVAIQADGKTVSIDRGSDLYGRATIYRNDCVAVSAGSEHTLVLAECGTIVCAGRSIKDDRCKVYSWGKAFPNLDALQTDRSAEILAHKKACIAQLQQKRAALQGELSNLKGFFSKVRRREIESQLAEIETELKGL